MFKHHRTIEFAGDLRVIAASRQPPDQRTTEEKSGNPLQSDDEHIDVAGLNKKQGNDQYRHVIHRSGCPMQIALFKAMGNGAAFDVDFCGWRRVDDRTCLQPYPLYQLGIDSERNDKEALNTAARGAALPLRQFETRKHSKADAFAQAPPYRLRSTIDSVRSRRLAAMILRRACSHIYLRLMAEPIPMLAVRNLEARSIG